MASILFQTTAGDGDLHSLTTESRAVHLAQVPEPVIQLAHAVQPCEMKPPFAAETKALQPVPSALRAPQAATGSATRGCTLRAPRAREQADDSALATFLQL